MIKIKYLEAGEPIGFGPMSGLYKLNDGLFGELRRSLGEGQVSVVELEGKRYEVVIDNVKDDVPLAFFSDQNLPEVLQIGYHDTSAGFDMEQTGFVRQPGCNPIYFHRFIFDRVGPKATTLYSYGSQGHVRWVYKQLESMFGFNLWGLPIPVDMMVGDAATFIVLCPKDLETDVGTSNRYEFGVDTLPPEFIIEKVVYPTAAGGIITSAMSDITTDQLKMVFEAEGQEGVKIALKKNSVHRCDDARRDVKFERYYKRIVEEAVRRGKFTQAHAFIDLHLRQHKREKVLGGEGDLNEERHSQLARYIDKGILL